MIHWTEPPLNDRYNQDALNEWMNKALYPYLNDVKKFVPENLSIQVASVQIMV